MPVKRDGRRVPRQFTGATSMPSQSAKTDSGALRYTTQPANPNTVGSHRTAPRFPIRTSDAVAWSAFTLIVGAFLIAACVLLTLGAPS